MAITKLKDLVKEEFVNLNKLQKGDKELLKTGEDFIDSHINGLLPGDCIVISGLSGQGKSETLFKMKENILNGEINKNASDIVFLEMSFEMKMFNILLRGINRLTKKKKSKILSEEFTEEEKKVVKKYYEDLQDDRQYIEQSPTSPKEFYDKAYNFLEEHRDKEAVVISVDHMLLLSGHDKQSAMEQLVENINQLKLRFDNCYFILLSQCNRSLLGRIADRKNSAAPTAADLYGSSFMDQISSYNIVIYNPFKLGINEYMRFNPQRYEYISEHYTDPDSRGKVSFDPIGKIFYHVIKTRESDEPYNDIFIKEMDISEEEKDRLRDKKDKEAFTPPPKFTPPENPYKDLPQFDNSVFEEGKEEDEEPPF